MTNQADAAEGAGKFKEALRDHGGFMVERMAGLARALDQFVIEAQGYLAPLIAGAGSGTVEPARGATLFQAIGECSGLTAAIYGSLEPETRLLIALDERIDEFIVSAVFGEDVIPQDGVRPKLGEPRQRTAIETALIEGFAQALGHALEVAFAHVAPLTIAFERLTTLSDLYALGRRDMPVALVRFSLQTNGKPCECLMLMPQSLLLPFRRELEQEATEPMRRDRLWSVSMETGVKQTRLPVTALVEELTMSLGDVARFRVGEVLPLQCDGFDALTLECAGRAMFLCKLGQGNGKYRLEIDLPVVSAVDCAFGS